VGNRTEIYKVADVSGNNATCQFVVRVLDIEAPQIVCPAPVVQNNDAGLCSAVVTYGAPVGTDNCAGQSTVRSNGLASGQTFNVGLQSVSYQVTDLVSLTANCSFSVTVVDAEVPRITCPSDVVVPAVGGLCSANVSYGGVTAVDNCGAVNISLVTVSATNGSLFAVGTTNVTFQAQDSVGLTSRCTFTVTVLDTQAPVITCPAAQAFSTDLNVCGTNVTYSIGYSDNCGPTTIQMLQGQSSRSLFAPGMTEVAYIARDLAGNTASCAFNVTISDNQVPQIGCPANISQPTDAGVCQALITYSTPVGTDNCPSSITNRTAGLASATNFPLGLTRVSYSVADGSGNLNTCSFFVHLLDTELPRISTLVYLLEYVNCYSSFFCLVFALH
jgi:hypothetical protein